VVTQLTMALLARNTWFRVQVRVVGALWIDENAMYV